MNTNRTSTDKEIIFDNTALRELILQKFGTIKKFASVAGMSATAVSNRLNNKTEFTAENIRNYANILGIAPNQIDYYFFSVAF